MLRIEPLAVHAHGVPASHSQMSTAAHLVGVLGELEERVLPRHAAIVHAHTLPQLAARCLWIALVCGGSSARIAG